MMHHNTKDLTGKRFGRLVVVALSDERGNRNQLKWLCQCDCGTQKVIEASLLRDGKTKSCGCLLGTSRLAHNKYPDREGALFNILYFSIKKRHNKKTKECCISKEYFIELSKAPCHYCGVTGSNVKKDIRRDLHKGEVKYSVVSDTVIRFNGIDRIDSNAGYTDINCVSCCKDCNTAKNSLTENEFRMLVRRIYEHWAK